jgi:hypothetical protein
MATRKITLSLDVTALEHAERAARQAGLSLSAWLSRAARREAVRTGCVTPPADNALADALADQRERELAEEDLRAAG